MYIAKTPLIQHLRVHGDDGIAYPPFVSGNLGLPSSVPLQSDGMISPSLRFAALSSGLDQLYQGDTLNIQDLSDAITERILDRDGFELKFSSEISNLWKYKVVIGQTDSMNQIVQIHITFYNGNDEVVFDNDNRPMDYTSTPADLGHLLEIFNGGYIFAYARCRFMLQPDANFDPDSLFFHFLKSSQGKRGVCPMLQS